MTVIFGGGGDGGDGDQSVPVLQPVPAPPAGSAGTAVAAAAAAGAAAAKEGGLPRGWVVVLQLGVVLVGALALVAGFMQWTNPPSTEIGKTAIEGKEIVVTKTTTTTGADKAETVAEEPAVAVAGRSETVVVAFLVVGTILLVAAALPGRSLTLKGAGIEATVGAVAASAAQSAEGKAKEKGADAAEVSAVGAAAAQEAAARLEPNLKQEQSGTLGRALGAVTRGRLGASDDPTEAAAKAAQKTVEEARDVAVERVLGPS